MGGYEASTLVLVEPSLKYHPYFIDLLTYLVKPKYGHFQVGSLTGAVASEIVTEARKGSLRLVGNQPSSVRV